MLYSRNRQRTGLRILVEELLQNGVTTIQIDPLLHPNGKYSPIEYRVFLTPEGNCKGLYVTNKTPSSFEVRELQDGDF